MVNMNMKRNLVAVAISSVLFLNACIETAKQESTEADSSEVATQSADDVVKTSSTDKDGKKLDVLFNNAEGTATLNFDGQTIELIEQKAASGTWYKNEHYELRGKGNDIELKKDGKVVFIHEDEIVTSSLKDKKGQTLDITFNNTSNEAKVYLNGGEQIDLVGQQPASGIWYKNDHYELRGKGESVELTKDGKTVFKN